MGFPCAEGLDTVWLEGVGDWCGRNIGSGGRATGWHSWLSTQTAVLIDVIEIIVVPGEIMMVSIDFVKQLLELIDFVRLTFP